jgi:membrane protein implicated in regulation of membrane protease activity
MFLVFAIIGLIAVVVGVLNANGGTAFLGVVYTAGMIAMMIYVKKGAKETKNKIKDIDENLNARK